MAKTRKEFKEALRQENLGVISLAEYRDETEEFIESGASGRDLAEATLELLREVVPREP